MFWLILVAVKPLKWNFGTGFLILDQMKSMRKSGDPLIRLSVSLNEQCIYFGFPNARKFSFNFLKLDLLLNSESYRWQIILEYWKHSSPAPPHPIISLKGSLGSRIYTERSSFGFKHQPDWIRGLSQQGLYRTVKKKYNIRIADKKKQQPKSKRKLLIVIWSLICFWNIQRVSRMQYEL